MPRAVTLRRAAIRAVLAVLVVTAVLVFPGRGTDAQQSPPFTLEVNPSQSVTDGQLLEINVRVGDPQHKIFSGSGPAGTVKICRPGVSYDREAFLSRGGNCPSTPFSTSGDLDNNEPLFELPDGNSALARIRSSAGKAVWTVGSVDPKEYELTCNETSPCLLVAEVRIDLNDGTGYRFRHASQALTFSPPRLPDVHRLHQGARWCTESRGR